MRYIPYFLIIALFVFASVASDQERWRNRSKWVSRFPISPCKTPDDQEHALKKMRGKVVFLIMGHRKIREEDDKWGHAFQEDYRENDGVVAYIVADMRSVPAFVPKGFIKRQLKKNQPPVTLLLDWKGKVHQAYHTQKEKPNLYVIDPEGKLAFHIESNFDKDTYQN